MDQRQQNSTAHGVLFFMADADDHISGKTGLTPTVTVSKNGGAFAAAAGSVSEVGDGWYVLAGNANDRDTLGELVVHGQASGADPADRRLTIVPWDPFDGNLGLPRLDAAITTRADAADYTPARAVKLDNLDATISSRSTLTAAGVWANATRTITGTVTGAITAASFAANAIDSAALATSAVTEIQSGLGTLANQATIIAYVDELESRLSATRAANLDNLDATVSSRSTLTAGDVWANATRTITGTSTGAIVAASFAANAIDAAALAASAVTEIQAGLATLANQATIISHVDDLENRLTAVRAANLDNLDATVSSRLAAGSYVAPDNVSIQTIETVLAGITSLADWLRAIVRQDAADPAAKAEINAGGGTYDEQQHSLVRAASLAELLEADRYIDTTVTPWALVLTRRGSGGPGVGEELLRQRLFTETGANVTSIDTFVGRGTA